MTPPALAQQWVDELALHAPSLKVLVYDGWSKVKIPITEADVAKARRTKGASTNSQKKPVKGRSASKRSATPKDRDVEMAAEPEQEQMADWCTYVNGFDVCITTYGVLAHDFRVARPPPPRPRREGTTYVDVPRAISPLVMCEWYRVIMDEVQSVGGGQTAYVALFV